MISKRTEGNTRGHDEISLSYRGSALTNVDCGNVVVVELRELIPRVIRDLYQIRELYIYNKLDSPTFTPPSATLTG